MTQTPLTRLALALTTIAAFAIGSTVTPAFADDAPDPAATAPVDDTPDSTADDDGEVDGLVLPEITPRTSVDATPVSLSQCSSGYFCVWSLSNYTGTLQRFKTTGKYSSISVSRVGSFYNNRSKRVFIYEHGGGSTSNCYGPRVRRSSTSGWLSRADSAYLSTGSSC